MTDKTDREIMQMAREAGLLSEDEAWVSLHQEAMERFAELLEAKVRADERNALLAAIEKLRDESHTILGASDDYKQGREMGIQLCINELTRGEK